MCAEAIQKAHRSAQARDGAWSGWGPRSSEIFAVDAIFAEADVGDILTETVEGLGDSCLSLFAPYSINDGQTQPEGVWARDG